VHKELFAKANITHYIPPGDWPPNSPDLSSIENIWSVMAAAVYAMQPRAADTYGTRTSSSEILEINFFVHSEKSHQFDA